MTYIKENKAKTEQCIFCYKAQHPEEDAQEHVVALSDHVYLTLNKYPYNNGHVMVIPYQHVDSQEALDDAALLDLMRITNQALFVLREDYHPPGFNLGVNLGAAAGAGIAEHYHFHIVPRWNGDANFMSTVGQARVIPEDLDTSLERLKSIWKHNFQKDS
ncbi:HIT domain-containing protein [Anaerolineales bacterium]